MTAPTVTTRSVATPEAMHELGLRLGKRLRAGDLIILTGPLGAGKTTLTRGIGEGLGVRGPVTSPTFVIARTHPSLRGGTPLVHVDAYRLHGPDELDDLDIDFEGSVVIVEWGAEMVRPGESWIELTITRPTGHGEVQTAEPGNGAAQVNEAEDWSEELVEPRMVTVTGYGPRWEKGVL